MSTFGYRLDLVLEIVDTTTGNRIEERNVTFAKDGLPLRLLQKADGCYILQNTGREDFDLSVTAYGYLPYKVRIQYEKLNDRLPIHTVYLIPRDDFPRGEPVIVHRGRIPKLEEMEAVCLLRPRCFYSDYNDRKQYMTLFKSGGGSGTLDDMHYGLVNNEAGMFEHIVVEENVDDARIRLKEPLIHEFPVNAPLYRVMFANILEKGNYEIGMRDGGGALPMIIRFRKGDAWYYYRTEDFRELDTAALAKAKKTKAPIREEA